MPRKKRKKVSTLFTEGMLTTQTWATHYSKDPIIATTGETMVCKGPNHIEPINVLINPYIGAELNDVNTGNNGESAYLYPIKLISNSIIRMTNWRYGVEISGNGNSNPTQSINDFSLNLTHINIGQEKDVADQNQKYLEWKKRHRNTELVCFGNSRGAATIFSSIALNYKKNSENKRSQDNNQVNYKELMAVVLEACFYSVDDVIEKDFSPLLQKVATSSLTFFTSYKPNGLCPGKLIDKFPKHIPVAFITSEKDGCVPLSSTKRLAEELANSRSLAHPDKETTNVYLLKLKYSSHANYPFDHPEDRKVYESFLHAFYKKCGVPKELYDKELARIGEKYLRESLVKPTIAKKHIIKP